MTVILLPYQKKWVEDPAKFKVGMWSRQVGKTFSSTFELVLDCLEAESERRRARWVILSRGERQAREAMEEGVKKHLQAFSMGFKAMEYDWEPSVRAMEVSLPGGSRITALPANPDTARGFSASVLLDEFAFHADSRKIWQAVFPIVSKPELKLRVISTPNGKGNRFYELMTDTDSIWSRHQVTIYDAVAQGLPRDVESLRAGVSDPDAWAQEYELEWLDEASAWLDYELIASVEYREAGVPDLYQGGPCYLGMDIGRRRDLTVIWVAEKVGDVLWCREVVRMLRKSFAEQDAELDRIMRHYNIIRLCMDQTGMGEKPVEDAQRRYGKYRVEGVLFNALVKQELAVTGKQQIEDRKVRIPIDRETRESHHAVKKITTAAGNPRFDAERTEQGHADEYWSHMLAIHAASVPAGVIEFQSTGNRRSFTRMGAYLNG
jgi:phage FluMu gp28-like protein